MGGRRGGTGCRAGKLNSGGSSSNRPAPTRSFEGSLAEQQQKTLLTQVKHWPSLSFSRTSNWGWMIQNHWVVYSATLAPNGPYSGGILDGQQRHLI